MSSNLINLIPDMVFPVIIPLMLVGLGGLFNERSGVVNIGLEGLMTVGAFVGAVVSLEAHSIWLGGLAAILVGGIFSLLHAFAAVSLRMDQIVSGVILNILGIGLAIYCCRSFYDDSETPSLPDSAIFFPVDLPSLRLWPIVGGFFSVKDFIVYPLFLLVLLSYFVLYRTTWGLRLRSVGENPCAADSAGISVKGMRYAGVVLGGMFAGLGGAFLSIVLNKHFSSTTVLGQGFLALAILIFGKWRPLGVLLASTFFGSAMALKTESLVNFSSGGPVLSDIIAMIPYLLTLLALAGFVGKTEPPKAIGIAYDPEGR